ncbi:hypothetical protein EAF04_005669 [Stromatinia cepivora]|nr:hypothetical protein EAF04_005669 [Stromatinia cepivora]
MIVEHTEQRGHALDLRYWERAAELHRNLSFFGPGMLLQDYFHFFNDVFFVGMIKDSVVADFAPDEYKNIFKLEFVSDEARAIAVGLGSNLGLTSHVGSGYFMTTTIYIRDIRTGDPNEVFHEVMIKMLGTLAHEMVHAMDNMYSKYLPVEENVNRAWHCTSWQLAAHAIERATSQLPVGHAWLGLRLDLGREFSAADDIVLGGYKEPTARELRNMGMDAGEFRAALQRRRLSLNEIAASWYEINDQLSYLTR